MKQHVGKMGQLRGVNLEKVRLSIKEPSASKVDIKKSIPLAQINAYDPVLSQSSQGNKTFPEQKFSLLARDKKLQRGNSL